MHNLSSIKTLFFIYLALLTMSCSSKRLITGTIPTIGSDDSIVHTSHLRNGIRSGYQISYYKNGQVKSKFHYINGKKAGEQTTFYEDGQIKSKLHYMDGKKAGEHTKFYKEGQLKWKGRYIDGKFIHNSVERFDSLGNSLVIKNTHNPANTPDTIIYYKSSEKDISYKELLNNKIEGFTYETYTSGAVDTAYYKQNKSHGPSVYIDSLGYRFEKNYSEGKRTGDYRVLNPEGTIVRHIQYSKGSPPDTLINSPRAKDIGIGKGNRSKASIMKVVRANAPQFRKSYNKYLRISPGLEGKIEVRFKINKNGVITNTSVIEDYTGNKYFVAEVLHTLHQWSFDEIPSGDCTITLPLAFSE